IELRLDGPRASLIDVTPLAAELPGFCQPFREITRQVKLWLDDEPSRSIHIARQNVVVFSYKDTGRCQSFRKITRRDETGLCEAASSRVDQEIVVFTRPADPGPPFPEAKPDPIDCGDNQLALLVDEPHSPTPWVVDLDSSHAFFKRPGLEVGRLDI